MKGWPLDLLLIGVLVVCKVLANTQLVDFSYDGNYYYDIARNLRDGNGFTSSIAMYHQAFREFPSPTPVYPVWPTLLGLVGSVFSLSKTAIWLPTIFYFGTLVLGMRLCDQLWRHDLLPEFNLGVRARHMFLVVFGYNPEFFAATSRPYTEGLAWFCMCLALFRFRHLFALGGLGRGIEAGLWMAFLMCIRSQFVVVAAAVGATLVGASVLVAPRRPWLLASLGFGVGFAVGFVPLLVWYSTFLESPSLSPLLRFEQWRPDPRFTPVSLFWPTDGVVDWLRDRAGGFFVAYNAHSNWSYTSNFGTMHVTLPVLLLPLLLRALRPGALGDAWAWVRRPEHGFFVFLGVFALAQFLFIHSIHKAEFAEWNFGMRHAVGVGFLFTGCAIALFTLGKIWRLLGFAIVVASVHVNVGEIYEVVEEIGFGREISARRATLEPWLLSQTTPNFSIVVQDPQRFAQHVPGVGFHCAHDFTTCDDLALLLGDVGADYWLVPLGTSLTACEDQEPVLFDAYFERYREAPPGWIAYRLKSL